jgi:hypothetical protein
MIIYKVNKQRYAIKSEWGDWTLREAMQLAAHEYPKGIESAVDWYEHLPTVRDVWRLFTDIDPDMVQPHWLIYVFDTYCAPLWEDLYSDIPRCYMPRGLSSFDFGGVTYKLPTSLPFDGGEVLGVDLTARRFVEAGNLLAEFARVRRDGIRRLPYLVAAVVSVEGEGYDEAVVLRRASLFYDLPMPIVWEVFFSLLALLRKCLNVTLASMAEEAERLATDEVMRSGRTSWLRRAWQGASKRSGSYRHGSLSD